jgi:DNA-binding transcriptional MerR regulator
MDCSTRNSGRPDVSHRPPRQPAGFLAKHRRESGRPGPKPRAKCSPTFTLVCTSGVARCSFGEAGAQTRVILMNGSMPPDKVEIPNRSLFRQPEVCEIAQVQSYVLRSWEAEFPDLGVTKTEGGPRVYRRADVERVLRIKHLLFVEGLTLAGVRRKLTEEGGDARADKEALKDVAALFGVDARERILQVKRGLREIASMLSRRPAERTADNGSFELKAPPVKAVASNQKVEPPQQQRQGKKTKKKR